MTLTFRDIGWIISVLIPTIGLVAVFATYKQKIDVLRKIIFDDTGRLNVVDSKSCSEYRNDIHDTQKEYEADSKKSMEQLNTLNLNVALIVQHLEIKTPNGA